MSNRLPLIAVLLGILGLIPFIVTGLGALSADAVQANRAMLALLGYGAVILSFLGGVHWGFVLAPAEAPPAIPGRRLLLGVVPALIGWLAVLAPLAGSDLLGLALLLAGYLGTIALETRAARSGLMPTHYLWLRWAISAVVVAMLVSVLTLRLLGAHLF